MVRDEIRKIIKDALGNLQGEGVFPDFELPEIKIDRPSQKSHGDYSSNIAFEVAKRVKKNPGDVSSLIVEKVIELVPSEFKMINAESFGYFIEGGFINIKISDNYLRRQLEKVLSVKGKFGNSQTEKGKKIQVEFISANPTGPLTVGNARGGPVGDVLANVLAKAGAEVERAYYINDFGAQILTLGHSVLKDSDAAYRGEYIDYLNKKIKEKNPFKAGQKAALIIINEMIKKTVDRMRINYDEWFSEKSLHESGAVNKALAFLKEKNLLYKKDEAVWFKSTDFGDIRDRVVVTTDKRKTYLAGDIAYHRYKFEKKKFDKVINIWGADHHGDVPGLQAGVAALGHKGKLDIVLLQFVTLLESGEKVKMSKREGKYVTMDELLAEVGSDVIRFFFLQKSSDTHLNFDLSLAKEQSEKNPVFYVQYAYARISSILRKAKIKNQKSRPDLSLLKEEAELGLIKQLVRLPEIIEDTANDYQVQRIPSFVLELATAFHQFYTECRVIDENNKALSEARLALVLATKIILESTLFLLGISAPEKM